MDLKALGYFISSISVLLLGAIAWPKPDEPRWHMVALLLGMALSIAGMGVRWVSHHREKKEVEKAKREAEGRERPDR